MKFSLHQVLMALTLVTAPFFSQAAETSTWQHIKQTGELRIGVAQGEPWYFKDPATGQWDGIGYNVGKDLAKELGVKLVPVETTWGNAIAALQTGQIDTMLVLDPTDERKKAVDFPDQPFFWYAQGVLVRDGIEVANWDDLNRADIKIGVTLGSSPDLILTKRLPKVQLVRFTNMDEGVAAFYAGRVDALSYFHPALALQQAKVGKGNLILPKPIVSVSTSGAIRKESDPTFRQFLNDAFAKLYTSGKTQQYYEQALTLRGVDVSKVPSVIKEEWK
ncbi:MULTISPECIES: transporter substrate-binding domain-containing protein [Brenneria]|uniref:Amino acid ABC transporter n=1 Tax=Brenneria nigrifluens DSM 30175 = ATCC 13028 TaxID=1121120 RepID=A0A2U1UC65_9GAMM|nr:MULTISPECIES: transporter substrate-binding domain-containing protein [Brenneria]PWC19261.1 amino acid ABC transporter [Brenneria nigrifluens DSM 30175 = ATCC 13028]QCR04002.1 amino acid ABC transporter [Brenneria nigrifluens DSM 30175 = ATCC 13028]